MTAAQFIEKVDALCTDQARQLLRRHVGSRSSVSDDVLLDVQMSKVLRASRDFADMPLDQVERLLASPVHELRAGALRIMGDKVLRKKVTEDERAAVYNLFMKHKDKVNSWGLVDISSHHIVGGYLLDRPRDVLYEMARAKSWWEHRIALVSTLAFVRRNDLDDTFRLAEMLRNDEHDKVQTAVGWLLRDAGKRDRARLLAFLDTYAATLPRVALRRAIEHLDKQQRAYYLGMNNRVAGGG